MDVGAGIETQADKFGRVYWAKVKAFEPTAEKPLRVERTYRDKTHTINCYVTTQIRDEHQAGTLTIGDYVLISFIDGNPDKALRDPESPQNTVKSTSRVIAGLRAREECDLRTLFGFLVFVLVVTIGY